MQKLILLAGLCVIAARLGSSERLVCHFNSGTGQQPADIPFGILQLIDPDLCTHVIYSSVITDKGGIHNIHYHDQKFKDFNGLKISNPQLKTLLEVKLTLSSDVTQASSINVITSIINTLQQYGFDGLNIFRTTATDSHFSNFIQNLRLALIHDNLLLTATVSADQSVISDSSQVIEIANNVDFLNVMTSGLDLNPSNPIFPNVRFAMESWVGKGVPEQKLNLGIAAFGQVFTPFSHGFQPDQTLKQDIRTDYKVCSGQLPSAWVGYDSMETLIEKVAYIWHEKFGGAFVMPISLDQFSGTDCNPGVHAAIQNLRFVLAMNP